MILVSPFAAVEGALNGFIVYAYGYHFWWSYEYSKETPNV
jgi:hypothetical protein